MALPGRGQHAVRDGDVPAHHTGACSQLQGIQVIQVSAMAQVGENGGGRILRRKKKQKGRKRRKEVGGCVLILLLVDTCTLKIKLQYIAISHVTNKLII